MSAADLRPRELDPRRAVSVQEITVMVLPDAGVRGGVRVRTSRTGVVGDIRLVEGAVSGDLDSADLLLGGVNSLGETRQVARQGRDVPPFLLVAEATIVEELPGIDASGAAAVLAYPLDTVELASVAHGIAGSGPFLSPRLPQLSVEPLGEGLSAREAEVVVGRGTLGRRDCTGIVRIREDGAYACAEPAPEAGCAEPCPCGLPGPQRRTAWGRVQ